MSTSTPLPVIEGPMSFRSAPLKPISLAWPSTAKTAVGSSGRRAIDAAPWNAERRLTDSSRGLTFGPGVSASAIERRLSPIMCRRLEGSWKDAMTPALSLSTTN